MENLKEFIAANISAYWHAYWPWAAVFAGGFVAGSWLF